MTPRRYAQRQPTLITVTRRALEVMLNELTQRLRTAGHPGVRPSHSRVFENLDSDGTRLTVLAARAQMSHPSMSELVGSIERLGYVERVPDPNDGRARVVRLTGKGRTLQRQALAELRKLEAEWSRRAGPVAGQELAAALGRIGTSDDAAGAPDPHLIDGGGS